MVDFQGFADESNRIEGMGFASEAEVEALRKLVALEQVGIDNLCDYVGVVQPGAELRDRPGLDVQVGGYIAPRGGPDIRERLTDLLIHAAVGDSFVVHRDYESLHPFTDGNGRSGRALWLWMRGGAPLLFLHEWYYQSLEAER